MATSSLQTDFHCYPRWTIRTGLSFLVRSMDDSFAYDVMYDPNEAGADLVVECWISQGPRATGDAFDPQPGDWLRAGDDELAPRNVRVIRRDGNRVWVQMQLLQSSSAVA